MSVTLYFASNTETMLATKALRDVGVAARMIPKPQDVESKANLCLSIEDGQRTVALDAIRTAHVDLGGMIAA